MRQRRIQAVSLSVQGGYRTGGGVARPTNYHIVPSIIGGVLRAVTKPERYTWWLGGEIKAYVFGVTSLTHDDVEQPAVQI